MNLIDYGNNVKRTIAPMGLLFHNIHMILGMTTEVGELTDIFKKALAYGVELDQVHIKEEVGDLMWYVMGFCIENDYDLGEILDKNIEKLKARYPEKFTTEKAVNRNLDKERNILEGTSTISFDMEDGEWSLT